AKLAPLRKRVQKIEQRIAALDRDKRELDTTLANPSLYGGASTAQMLEMSQRSAGFAGQIAALETEWLSAQHELESSEST
ncbi:MAG: ABC transporter ATP-binding protein, partial [Rudaea sp.]